VTIKKNSTIHVSTLMRKKGKIGWPLGTLINRKVHRTLQTGVRKHNWGRRLGRECKNENRVFLHQRTENSNGGKNHGEWNRTEGGYRCQKS